MSHLYAFGIQRLLGGRLALVGIVVLLHGVAIYAVVNIRARHMLDGPPMFAPATTTDPKFATLLPIKSRPYTPPVVELSAQSVTAWHFPRVDIWPQTGEPIPAPSEFGPLMDSDPMPELSVPPPVPLSRKAGAALKADEPRMIVWLRPAYPKEWASDERGGTVRLRFTITSTGAVSNMEVEQSSGSNRLDAIAVTAANSWWFQPAKSDGQNIASRATVDLTFRF